MTEKVHWTKTPEGRARMAKIARESVGKRAATIRKQQKLIMTGPKGGHHSMASRKKISAAMKASYARRQHVNGATTAPPVTTDETPVKVKSGRGFAKDAVRAFAFAGARLRLQQLDRERVEILMFLKDE